MKSKGLNTKEEIISWLEEHGVKNYVINNDLTVDVAGSVKLNNKSLLKIPVKFNIVAGEFDCSNNFLTSLEFCPSYVGGDFQCVNNKLKSLRFCPVEVGGDFNCSNNELLSLKYCPEKVEGGFYCAGNKELGDFKAVFEFQFFINESKRLKVENLEKEYGAKTSNAKKTRYEE